MHTVWTRCGLRHLVSSLCNFVLSTRKVMGNLLNEMNIMRVLMFLAVLTTCVFASSPGKKQQTTRISVDDSLIEDLLTKIAGEQVKADESYIPLFRFEKQRGIYESDVKLNFFGNFAMAEMRRKLNIFDNNMFVTSWVMTSLLESFRYGRLPKLTEEHLILGLDAMRGHHDMNRPYNTSIMTFWRQVFNDAVSTYQSVPFNLEKVIKTFDDLTTVPMSWLEKILKRLDLDLLADDVQNIIYAMETLLKAFQIPPDFDDTFVNLGLGSLLYQTQKDFPTAWGTWNEYNNNISSVFNVLKKYAYRPFSRDRDVNSIDPRTYLWLSRFLDKAQQEGQDVALVTTWVQDLKEVRTDYYKGVAMPFQVNNVDATVMANTVHGITTSILSGLVSPEVLDDPDIMQIYHNSSAAIAFAINSNMTNRPELTLTYYPSIIEFDWFVSRTFDILDAARRNKPLPRTVMEEVYQILKSAVQGEMTRSILFKAKKDGTRITYFDDFLGDNDVTFDNKTLVRGEDRIFTTSMAVNALLCTWTSFNQMSGTVHWKHDVPAVVLEAVTGSIRWLTLNTLSGDYKPWNAFFTGSVKGENTLPYWYPGNRLEYLNGTTVGNWSTLPKDTFVYCVEGYVDPGQYQRMLKQDHFGKLTPTKFQGYNAKDSFFPLWSSVAYSYSSTLLALTRYNNIAQG